jgi:hypothetical protein
LRCSDCLYCRKVRGMRYAICNIEMSREEYEKKMKELENEK